MRETLFSTFASPPQLALTWPRWDDIFVLTDARNNDRSNGGEHGIIDEKTRGALPRRSPARHPARRPGGPGPPARRHRRPHGRPAGQARRRLGLGREGRGRHGGLRRPGAQGRGRRRRPLARRLRPAQGRRPGRSR
ncbi:MAG: hypothetical protein MZV63_64460 [Marinilabiliales bacterium]|nr:hypothetical protein [Marinilabiliales bacterium]